MSLRSRADLLYALAHSSPSAHDGIAGLLGYEQPPSSTPNVQAQPGEVLRDSEPVLTPLMHDTTLWGVDSVVPVDVSTPLPVDAPPALTLSGEPVAELLPAAPLVRRGVLMQCFDRLLDRRVASREIALRPAVRCLAQGAPVDRLPRRQRRTPCAQLLVLFDWTLQLLPARDDWVQIAQHLRAYWGKDEVQFWRSGLGPLGPWYDDQDELADLGQIAKGTVCLVVSDFAADADGRVHKEWSTLLNALAACVPQLRLLSLSPLRERRWPHASLEARPADPANVENLLTGLTPTLWPQVTQLNRLSRALGASLADAVALYRHPEIEHQGDCLGLRREAHQARIQTYPNANAQLKARIARCLADWHPYLSETWQEAEHVLGELCRGAEPDQDYPRLQHLATLATDKSTNTSDWSHDVFIALTDWSCQLADSHRTPSHLRHFLQVAQSIAQDHGIAQPFRERSNDDLKRSLAVFQQADRLSIDQAARVKAPLLEITAQAIDTRSRRSISSQDMTSTRELTVYDQGLEYTLAPRQKPNWAQGFYRNSNGHLEATHADGARFELIPASAEQPKSEWHLTGGLWPWAKQAGIDEHGLWATLAVNAASYRLRWIPPGTFMMGSPETEELHDDDEHLHEVTLSEGYWLGETTVTQDLWRAVTGQNPSKGGDDKHLPVNTISWDDCRAFTKNMREQLPSFDARLPSEAEWEYACRAGTSTPFWWGDEPSKTHGNMNIEKGSQIESQYPANTYGLKSMHGNMEEWCMDWYGKYSDGPVTNPQGPEKGQIRVLRGGSWFYGPQFLRSAFRNRSTPVYRNQDYGFRLAGGCDPQASERRGAAQTADRDEGTEEQRGGQGRPSPGKNA